MTRLMINEIMTCFIPLNFVTSGKCCAAMEQFTGANIDRLSEMNSKLQNICFFAFVSDNFYPFAKLLQKSEKATIPFCNHHPHCRRPVRVRLILPAHACLLGKRGRLSGSSFCVRRSSSQDVIIGIVVVVVASDAIVVSSSRSFHCMFRVVRGRKASPPSMLPS